MRTRNRNRLRRGGFTLLSVGPSLLVSLWLTGLPGPTAGALWGTDGPDTEPTAAEFPDEFPLFPTLGNEGASGRAVLKQTWSPFGVSVAEDGSVQYELTVAVAGLPEVEGETYRVWLTTPTLESVVDFGVVPPEGEVHGSNDFHQLMVIVSREPADRHVGAGDRWTGPIVLRGFSAGARVTPLAQHSLFRPSPM